MNMDVCLSWSSHGKVLSDGIWKFFQENYRTDLALSLSGNYMKVHHIILAIFCPLIKEIETDKFIKGEDEAIEKEDLKHLVEFMYRGKINVPQNRLPTLLRGAETLGFKALADVIKKYISVQNKTDSVRKQMRQSRLKAKQALDKPDTQNLPADKDESEGGNDVDETPSAVVGAADADGSNADDDFYKERPSYRRTVDCNSFDPASLQHICKHCNEGFEVFDDYVNHIRQHENPELAHKCPHCSYRTRLKFGLVQHVVARHQVDMHGRKLQRNLKCPKCDYACFAKFQLQNHLYTVHAAKPLKCDKCNYSTTSRANLHKHVRFVHLNERPFMCDTCGSRFKTFQAFRNHLTTHIGKKRVCDVCGANLTMNSFKSHMKTHSADRPHPCHLCSFAARKRYNLKVHLKNVHKFSKGQLELHLRQEASASEVRDEVRNNDLNVAIMEMNADFDYGVMASTSEYVPSI